MKKMLARVWMALFLLGFLCGVFYVCFETGAGWTGVWMVVGILAVVALTTFSLENL
jgi:hypothetical protein